MKMTMPNMQRSPVKLDLTKLDGRVPATAPALTVDQVGPPPPLVKKINVDIFKASAAITAAADLVKKLKTDKAVKTEIPQVPTI